MLAAVAVAAGAAAASSGAPTSIAGWFIAQGPVGVLALVIGYGWKRERDRADAERAGSQALVRELVDKILPALAESTRATRDLVDYSTNPRRPRG